MTNNTNSDAGAHAKAAGVINGHEIPVHEHKVFFIIPFAYDEYSISDAVAQKQMSEFAKEVQGLRLQRVPQLLGEDLLQDFASIAEDDRVWKRKTNQAVEDLIPVFKQLVGESDCAGDRHICEAYTLSRDQFFKAKRNPNESRLFILALRQKELSVLIEDPSLYVLLSGVGILILPVAYSVFPGNQLMAEDVLDGNYFLTHPSKRKDNQSKQHSLKMALTATSLMEIARSLLPESVAPFLSAERYFVYSVLRIPSINYSGDNEERLLAHRLAHRQNANYVPSLENIRKDKLENFEYIIHAAAIEGGATLIRTDDSPSKFLETMIRNQISNTYLPLLISEIHSHYWLIRRTEHLALSRPGYDDHDNLCHLENLNRGLLNFTRYYHYPFPSRLTPHNEFHALWQSVFGVERLLGFLIETAKEVAEEARKVAEQRRDRQLAIVSYASAGFSGLVGVQQLLGVLRDKQLDNMYLWQSRLFIGRGDLLREPEAVTRSPDWKQKLQSIDAEIVATTQLAQDWEGYIFWGSWIGLLMGILVAWYFRKRK